ncbi:MAG: N-formylglutamate amidohydrolase [Caulobacteraceae bacterium]|nr:MAG: N-formylglutamate amidohydrolase [Caulobacteraceae bacterium]
MTLTDPDRTQTPAPPAPGSAAFRLVRPGPGVSATPLIFASPHSGRIYPPEMLAAVAVGESVVRRSEDAFVDELIAAAPTLGASIITAGYGRAYIDLNRDPWELDPAMFEDELPPHVQGRTARVAAGLGAIAKLAGEGQKIYGRKLRFAEAEDRIRTAHRPYHEALSRLIDEAHAAHGLAILIDWHSMPSAAARTVVTPRHGKGCDMVLGDRFGAACAPGLTRLVEKELEAMGHRVVRNAPYAGGYTTEFYGRPARRIHALQIEIDRALYLDEKTLAPTEGLERLKDDVARLTAALAQGWRDFG